MESLNDDETNDDDFCDNNITDKLKTQSGIKKRTNSRVTRSAWFNREAQPEKHYRELLMLFTPWRNEETDLISHYTSFQEHYLARYDEIGEQMKQYAVCSEDLGEIQQHLNDDDEDQFDSIAPVTQNTELQDEDEGNQDLHPDLNKQYDMSEDIGIPSTAQNNEPLILHEVQDDEYRGLVQSLNKKQKEFFQHALHFIKTSDNPFYAFLSGGGGVGKSHLIKSIYQAIKYYNSKAGEDFHQVKVLLLAPTGKAAFIIKGNTIHRALAVPASQSLKNYKPLDCSRLNTLRSQLGGVKLILLDEVSMVGSNMFTVQINNRLKDIKGSKEDFGGVSIIGIGDLFQLPPVFDSYIFNDIQNSEYSILVPNLWKKYFKMFELDEIMRQRESKMFAEILNRLREGKQTKDDIIKIKERCTDDENCPREAPRLFVQNAMVDDYNQTVYQTSTGNKYTINAQDSVIGAMSDELREKIMRQIPHVPLKNTEQLARKLRAAEGERTEIALNVRTDDGLTNGASNVVTHVKLSQPNKPSGIIWVEFDDEDVGKKTRQENRHLYRRDGIQLTWTPIKPVTTQFAVGRTKSAQVVRKQFPLRPAAAKTVHRSQGDTQTQIVANLNTKRAIPHIHYVTLSRVTTMEGLYITDLCENKIAVDPKVVKEMLELRTQRRLELCFTPLYQLDPTDFKICHLNARSLHKHIDDVRKDFNYNSCDVAIFTETRFSPHDNNEMYAINGFQLFRNDDFMSSQNNRRPYHATAVYSKLPFVEGYPYGNNINGVEFTVIKIQNYEHINIIAVYRSPQVPLGQLCSALQHIVDQTSNNNIFIGDFNVNWLVEVERQSLYNVMVRDNSYRQLIDNPTTENNTLIDHTYTNIVNMETVSGNLET